jgi:hypothetical protein
LFGSPATMNIEFCYEIRQARLSLKL